MIRMSALRRYGVALALTLAAPAVFAPAAQAQDKPSAVKAQPDHPAYADLYKAMEEAVDQRMVIEGALSAMTAQFAATPEFAQAEAASPGLIEEIVMGLRPVFAAQSERVRLLYRPANIALFARNFTPEEATTIAAFYRSDIGRKLMGNLSRTYVPTDTLAAAGSTGTVSRDNVEADLGRAIDSAMGGMSEDEMMEMGKMALANPALLKLNRLGGAVKELRVQMENEQLTAEEQKQVEAVIIDVLSRRFQK